MAQNQSSSAPDTSRRSERSRRAIYDAALALVAEVGYPKTTIEGIASRAGVGKQTIYRWWSSKADVLLDAFLDLSNQAAEAAGQVPYSIPDSGDLAADLKYVLRATVDELHDPAFEAPSRALAAEGLVNEELGRRFVAQLLEPQLQLYVDRLRTAQEAGRSARRSTRASPWSCSSPRSPSAGSSTPARSPTSTPTPSSTTPCTASPPADPEPAGPDPAQRPVTELTGPGTRARYRASRPGASVRTPSQPSARARSRWAGVRTVCAHTRPIPDRTARPISASRARMSTSSRSTKERHRSGRSVRICSAERHSWVSRPSRCTRSATRGRWC